MSERIEGFGNILAAVNSATTQLAADYLGQDAIVAQQAARQGFIDENGVRIAAWALLPHFNAPQSVPFETTMRSAYANAAASLFYGMAQEQFPHIAPEAIAGFMPGVAQRAYREAMRDHLQRGEVPDGNHVLDMAVIYLQLPFNTVAEDWRALHAFQRFNTGELYRMRAAWAKVATITERRIMQAGATVELPKYPEANDNLRALDETLRQYETERGRLYEAGARLEGLHDAAAVPFTPDKSLWRATEADRVGVTMPDEKMMQDS